MKKLTEYLKYDKILSNKTYQYIFEHLKNNIFEYHFLDHFLFREKDSSIIKNTQPVDLFLLGSISTGIQIELIFLYISDLNIRFYYIPKEEFNKLVLSKENTVDYSFYKTNDIYSELEIEEQIISGLEELEEYYSNELLILQEKIDFSKLLN
jgi:hypothetical protein